jgi:predicted MFS family arabinose efflux permease
VGQSDLARGTRANGPAPRKKVAAFGLIAFALAVTSLEAGIPTPLYIVYQQQFHFTDVLLTLVFAVYVGGVFATLFLISPLSDSIGRKPILYAGLALTGLSAVAFIFATGVLGLVLARLLSGLSVGATTSTASATLIDLEPHGDERHAARVSVSANMIGFAVGTTLSGFTAQYLPDPLILIYLVAVALSLAGILAIALTPETISTGPDGRRFHFQRIVIPPGLRTVFWVAAGVVWTCYSIYGLFAALAPSYLKDELQVSSHLVAGLVVGELFAAAAIVQFVFYRWHGHRALRAGLRLMLGAVAVYLAALLLRSIPVFLTATLLLGIAFGLAFMGSLVVLDRNVPKQDRGEVISGYYVAAYLSLSIPVIGVGLTAQNVGLTAAGVGFGTAILVLVLVILAAIGRSAKFQGSR